MTAIQDGIAALRIARESDPFDIHAFDRILSDLHDHGPAIIAPLMGEFRDAAHEHAMFSMLHTIEAFDLDTYVAGVVQGLPNLASASREWLAIVVVRLLNSDAARAALFAKADKDAVTALAIAAEKLSQHVPEATAQADRLRAFLVQR